MTVALVLDFPGGTKQQYDKVVEGMQLGGRMAEGGICHAAGSYEGGWRVIDVWEDMAHFERFRDEQIVPHTQAAGLGAPNVRVMQVDEEKPGSGEPPAFVQIVMLPGLDREAFKAGDEAVLASGIPAEIAWHVNGPLDGGWCVIDAWTSKKARDELLETRVKPAMENAPLQGPPQIEELVVEASMGAGAQAAV